MNTKTSNGRFIVIDGPNAVGKSTVVKLVAQCLREAGKKVLETKEPTSHFNR